jgi:hypothetical protein
MFPTTRVPVIPVSAVHLINARYALKNNISKHRLMKLNLEEQYEPVTSRIENVSEELKQISGTLENLKLDNGKTLQLQSSKNEHDLSDSEKQLWTKITNMKNSKKEKGTLRLSEVKGDNRIYQIGDRLVAINNNLVIKTIDGEELKLNNGLVELFFKSNPDPSIFNLDDIKKYNDFIKGMGLTINNNTQKQKIISTKRMSAPPTAKGDGIAVIIPHETNKLLERLQILKAAKKEGHNDVSNEINEILKVLMERKVLTPEKFKKYLKK